MSEDRFERFLKETLEEHEVKIPRDHMWEAVQRSRAASDIAPDQRSRRLGRHRWILRVAAVLVLGFALGRISVGILSSPQDTGPVASTETEDLTAGASNPYMEEAAVHFTEAEVMLAVFSASDPSELREETSDWALGLLATTQALLDSPAGEDPEVHNLLEELEVILAQIGSLAEGEIQFEKDFIERSFIASELMARLEAAADPSFLHTEGDK